MNSLMVAVVVTNPEGTSLTINTYEVDWWTGPIVNVQDLGILMEDLMERYLELRPPREPQIISWQRFEEWPSNF